MMEIILELIESCFFLALMAAVVAAPVALLALVVDLLAGGWMAARFRCWLWVVVAIRLLMPLAPGSAVSLQYVWSFPDLTPTSQVSATPAALETTSSEREKAWSDPAVPSELRPAPVPTNTVSKIDWEVILAIALITTWLIGAAWALLRAVVASVRFRRQLQALPAVDDSVILDTVRLACGDIGVTAPVIKRVPDLPAPALFGLRRPTLCLPAGEDLTDAQLRMIALHEAMHIRRRDGWLAWLLAAVRAAHWCNPVAWLTVRQVEQYREQACDDAVRRHTHADQHVDYAELLLRFATASPARSNLGLIGLWFARPAKRLSVRIAAFTTGDCARRLPWFVSAATVAIVALVGLTDATGGSDSPEYLPQAAPAFSVGGTHARPYVDDRSDAFQGPPQANPIEEKTYDLTSALENADSIPEEADRKQWLLNYAKLGLHPAAPLVQQNDDAPNVFTLTMPRRQHEFFANALAEVTRLGHTYQVVVETRVVPSEVIERIPGIDWRQAVKYASPDLVDSSSWSDAPPVEAGKPSASVESVSFEFVPWVVFSLEEADMQKVVKTFEAQRQIAIVQSPKVTLFSGQTAAIREQSQTPFVTSVEYVQGELATAAQPNVVVIDQGVRIDFSPKMYDDEQLDLRCRMTLSAVDKVRSVKLPGQDVAVQSLKVTRKTISTTARMKQGESLLIGSPGEKSFYYAITPRWFSDPVATDE